MIRATNVKRGRISEEGLIRIKQSAIPVSRNPYLKTGDVIVVRRGAYTGDVAMINEKWAGSVAGYDLVVSPGKLVDSAFCAYALLSSPVQRHFKGLSNRAAQAHLNRQQLQTTPIPLPPLHEQKKIAHILSTVQRAIEAQERIIQTTTELKRALMHKLFTEGLCNEPQKQTEIGLVPESWSPITLGELCEKPSGVLQTGPFGSQLHKHEYQEDGIAVVNPTHLAGNRINHENVPRVSEQVAQRLGKHRLRELDILFARRGEIGRQGLVSEAEETWLCGTGCFLVRASKPFVDNRFLALYFATDRLVKWLYSHAAGAIMPNLNNIVMQRLPVFYPDLETQSTIIETFTSIDQKVNAAVRRQSALQDLFRTLLHELMTAKTRVNGLTFSSSAHYS
jgi:type I restriction enzyme S subunit